jgi:NADH-quinone oxidoreductase subunit E
MSGVHIAPPELQPASFAFTAENMELAKKHIAKYPAGRQQSAVMPLLDIAQRQHDNWVPQAAIKYIAELLGMATIRVLEVASFYTMYNLAPVGRHFVQVCTTTPCWLAGSDKVLSACKKHLGLNPGETSADGQFTVIEVECLGACVNAPMLQYNDDFFEDLNEESTGKILEALKRGEKPKPGPQNGRLSSEPLGGATTLTTFNPASAGGSDD